MDENGEQLGVMSSYDANKLAESKGLDLVKINATSKPPVCKIMDYGKFKFDAAKRGKELRKKQQSSELREMRLSMNIDKHDIETKARQTIKLLQAGDKVKVSIRMRGREQAHAKLGVGVMDSFFELCQEVSEIDIKPHTEGRNIFMILKPKKPDKPTKGQDKHSKTDNEATMPKTKKINPNPPKDGTNSSVQSLGDKLSNVTQQPPTNK
jgi:translation initiation factor IF-3